ncbi:diguanylate cyclase [uncultured Rhodoblastus sp.]|uniref:GGDEF domain-containing response regulator n=1 Tax=uncultured Rhodoblastus sp. TaxID=543037 RepID=UPI0025CE0FC5|nr:diguanylate cyclase [uncultured Rhodoblastus sp.]
MRLVLVAADPALNRSLASLLEARGHEVAGFQSWTVARRQMETQSHANGLIVVEAGSDTPGPEICWEARLLASDEQPVYICLISRPLSSRDFIEALDCGADDVLQLPLSSDELYARLRAAQRLIQAQRKLFDMATRDSLTGLFNRPAFFDRATKLCREAEAPLAAIMIDIDHFKSVNDRHGHAGGDKALRAVADCLKAGGDIVGRIGGEEFALLVEGGDAGAVFRSADGLRQHIAGQEISVGATILRLTCSFGVAIGERSENIDELLRKADWALYAAKRSGRNKVALFETERARAFSRPDSTIRVPGPRSIALG